MKTMSLFDEPAAPVVEPAMPLRVERKVHVAVKAAPVPDVWLNCGACGHFNQAQQSIYGFCRKAKTMVERAKVRDSKEMCDVS